MQPHSDPRGRTATHPGKEGRSLAGRDLSGRDLAGADFTRADLTGANLLKADLREAKLAHASLEGAELTGADLRGAVLEDVNARNAGFGHADLRGAQLFGADFEGSTLSTADLRGADLRCACLRKARLREAKLGKADLTNADLRDSDMSLCNVDGAIFNNVNLREARLRGVRNFASAQWLGTDIRDINFSGAYRLRRFVIDQNYIKEFREAHRWSPVLYWIWWITSDCGRSAGRWCACIAAIVTLYAWLFTQVTVDFGGHHPNWFTAVYYSVVTLTTLGYGDILPASRAAQLVAIAEVITGYVMLGGLLSIFANKLARRGD